LVGVGIGTFSLVMYYRAARPRQYCSVQYCSVST
jgi:hypothetical protein